MKDYYLKFASKSEADSVLYRKGNFMDATQELARPGEERPAPTTPAFVPNYANIDVVGVIIRPTGAIDAEGNPATAPIDGWHVNVRVVDGEDESTLLPYAVTPTQPTRVWW
jgi:hypothetical protein